MRASNRARTRRRGQRPGVASAGRGGAGVRRAMGLPRRRDGRGALVLGPEGWTEAELACLVPAEPPRCSRWAPAGRRVALAGARARPVALDVSHGMPPGGGRSPAVPRAGPRRALPSAAAFDLACSAYGAVPSWPMRPRSSPRWPACCARGPLGLLGHPPRPLGVPGRAPARRAADRSYFDRTPYVERSADGTPSVRRAPPHPRRRRVRLLVAAGLRRRPGRAGVARAQRGDLGRMVALRGRLIPGPPCGWPSGTDRTRGPAGRTVTGWLSSTADVPLSGRRRRVRPGPASAITVWWPRARSRLLGFSPARCASTRPTVLGRPLRDPPRRGGVDRLRGPGRRPGPPGGLFDRLEATGPGPTASSVRLPDGRLLWLFGDTFTGTVDAAGVRHGATLVRNSPADPRHVRHERGPRHRRAARARGVVAVADPSRSSPARDVRARPARCSCWRSGSSAPGRAPSTSAGRDQRRAPGRRAVGRGITVGRVRDVASVGAVGRRPRRRRCDHLGVRHPAPRPPWAATSLLARAPTRPAGDRRSWTYRTADG